MLNEVNKYYIMNLEIRKDRRDECDEELQLAGITNYNYFNSTHWKDYPQDKLNSYLDREYRHVTKDLIAKKGLFGCGITHLRCIKQFLKEFGTDGTKIAVMLEDDFQIKNHIEFKDDMSKVINTTNDWNFIYLGGLRNPKNDKKEEYLTGLDIAVSVWNSQSYIIRNTQDIYDKMENLFERGYFADRAIRKLIRDDKANKHKYLITNPYLIVQRKSYSDINSKVK